MLSKSNSSFAVAGCFEARHEFEKFLLGLPMFICPPTYMNMDGTCLYTAYSSTDIDFYLDCYICVSPQLCILFEGEK
jgi:hypothetical protein